MQNEGKKKESYIRNYKHENLNKICISGFIRFHLGLKNCNENIEKKK